MTTYPLSAKAFGAAADTYNQHAVYQQRIAHRLWQMCCHHVPEKALILDAGCGTAHLWETIPRPVIGIDAAYEMCRKASQHIDAVQGVIESLPLPDASVDLVFSSYAMQWVSSLSDALKECLRVLKPEGFLAIAVPIEGTLHELASSYQHAGMVSPVMAFKKAEDYRALVAKCGIVEWQITHDHLTYPSVQALVRSITQVGAGTPQSRSHHGLMTPRLFQRMSDDYRNHYGVDDTIVASWNTLLMVARK